MRTFCGVLIRLFVLGSSVGGGDLFDSLIFAAI